MKTASVTWERAAGAEEAAAREKRLGCEKVPTKASICFNAILLAPSKHAPFDDPSPDVPTKATSSSLLVFQNNNSS
jgi:hypothetical protein